MLTEFEVRRRVEDIQVSNVPPQKKARMLMRLGRNVKLQFRSHARALSSKVPNPNSAASFTRRASSLRELYDEVRLAARRAYGEAAGRMGST